MRYLVTGATGLVGNNVCRLLIADGLPVRVLVRASSDHRPLEGLDVETATGDVRDADQVRRAMQGVDCVIHCAAHVRIGWSEWELAESINVEGTRHVAAAARETGVSMVHVSSVDALSAGRPGQPVCEETEGQPKIACPYVVTKRRAEQVVLEEVQRGLRVVIVNPGFMLGPWDWKPSSGQMVLAVANGPAPVAPRGGCSVCDVRDVARGILAAAERGQPGRRYILAGENMTYMDLWRMIAQAAGRRGPAMRMGPAVRWAAGAAGDAWGWLTGSEPTVNSAAIGMSSLFHYYSSERARRELGYACRPAAESVIDAWQWLCQKRGGNNTVRNAKLAGQP